METAIIVAASLICITLVSVFAFKLMALQQHTIDRLTDKLMARSYKEYTTMQPKIAEDKPRPQTKKPLSWYDDATIEEDEIQ